MDEAKLSLLLSCFSLLGMIFTGLFFVANIKVKVDTMWKFLFERAVAEGLSKGILKKNSPVRLSEEGRKLYEGMAGELQDWYRLYGSRLSDENAALELERRFRPRIIQEICVPNNLYAGACLVAALLVAKEGGDKGESTLKMPKPSGKTIPN